MLCLRVGRQAYARRGGPGTGGSLHGTQGGGRRGVEPGIEVPARRVGRPAHQALPGPPHEGEEGARLVVGGGGGPQR